MGIPAGPAPDSLPDYPISTVRTTATICALLATCVLLLNNDRGSSGFVRN